MNAIELSPQAYSRDEINQQLQKIITDPIFAVSDILKRFLLFVSDETLEGRSNQIKEYTIGINVLHKPLGFNPRQDAIVRIHAGRLRRALHQYYKGTGIKDPIYVAIPKGSYLPVFSENYAGRFHEEGHLITNEEGNMSGHSPEASAKFMVTGEMQYAGERLKITVQMVNTETHEEMWRHVVEYRISNSNGFDIQEDIAKKLVAAVGEYYRFIKQQAAPSSVMAVA